MRLVPRLTDDGRTLLMPTHFTIHTLLLSLLVIVGCQGYDVKINERVVYTPEPLFKDFQVSDLALRTCLEETIAQERITAAEQLYALNCSNAGIESLDGLRQFAALEILRLSSNKVRNLVELDQIPALRELYLDDNRIVDPVPLYSLPRLTYLDLSDNTSLQCPDLGRFSKATTVVLPKHCR